MARNARDVGSSPALGTIIPIFITLSTLVAVTMDPVQAIRSMVGTNVQFTRIGRARASQSGDGEFDFLSSQTNDL